MPVNHVCDLHWCLLTSTIIIALFFSTEVNSQVYELTLDLYGPVNASSITHTAMGFFVYIKMLKIVTGKQYEYSFISNIK
jgi:hypothetical protein